MAKFSHEKEKEFIKQQERERCAKIAESFGRMSSGRLLAEKIRSVKQEPTESSE